MAVISAAAFFLTAQFCGHTDGSFRITDPDARPSIYCRATDLFPPILTSARSVVADALLFGTPTVLVLVATVVASRRRRDALPPPVIAIALGMAVLTLLLSLFGDVGYHASF